MSRPAEAALEDFFAAAAHEHAETMARAGEIERVLRFGDRAIRLRFAGAPLERALMAALGPRAHAGGDVPVDATIGLWQEREAPQPSLAPPWGAADVGPRGLIRGREGAAVVAIHEAGSEALTLFHRETRALLHRVPSVAALPWWERAAPLRPALFWALSGTGRHLVHAGVVGDEQRGGVLLAGAGGSGKTTVALAALAAGMSYVGDDYVLVHSEGEARAWNLFATAKLDAGHLARFPQLAAHIAEPPAPQAGEKSVLDVERSLPGAIVDSLAIRAVLVPRIRGGHARLRRASAGEALLALAPSTAFQMPFDGGEVLGALAGVARGVPAFALDVGDDPGELAQAIDRVLDVAAGAARHAPEALAQGARR